MGVRHDMDLRERKNLGPGYVEKEQGGTVGYSTAVEHTRRANRAVPQGKKGFGKPKKKKDSALVREKKKARILTTT